ncbi:hypothetical protein EMPS_05111 [Entomortierella parvispora]|uniref:Uncharacterized protein n=1 Tax=Entomortierella parvispora TaxID=205924 RepID=A0A9P3HAF3_9FUNG|nr:hypothetical protein EMPS_05111 [Entomortierella parvispora]
MNLLDPTFSYPNLSSLEVCGFGSLGNNRFIPQYYQQLTSIYFRQKATDGDLEITAKCPGLEHLELNELELDSPESWILFYEALFSRLRSLSMDHGPLFVKDKEDTPPFLYPAPSKPSKLTDLSFGNFPRGYEEQRLVIKSQFWLLENCPDLKRLSWRKIRGYHEYFPRERNNPQPMRRIANLIESGQACQRLETIAFPGYEFSRHDFLFLLQKLTRLNVIDLKRSSFDDSTWTALKSVPRHLSTITVLDVVGSNPLPRSVIQSCMATMPLLQVLRAQRMSDDIITDDGREWVCLGLRELQLEFVLDKGRTSQPMILSRICKLTKLEYWRSMESESLGSHQALHLKLGEGLEYLQVLREMRTIRLRDTWDAREANWALRNWKDLTLFSSPKMDRQCMEVLQESGVKVRF